MRLYKTLTIGGEAYQLASESITLDIARPGRAIFQVVQPEGATGMPSGMVDFSLGWNVAGRQSRFITCDIERAEPLNNREYRLFCNEISARLDTVLPVALRHPNLKQVLQAYSAKTGLNFILPERGYATVQVPAFYGVGTGFQALANIGPVFGIDDYVWLTQGDGKIFVGSWQDSRWPDRGIEIPREFYKSVSFIGNRSIAAIPGLRPGALVDGQRVVRVEFAGQTMRFQCERAEN